MLQIFCYKSSYVRLIFFFEVHYYPGFHNSVRAMSVVRSIVSFFLCKGKELKSDSRRSLFDFIRPGYQGYVVENVSEIGDILPARRVAPEYKYFVFRAICVGRI